jgi:hypothetical protein
MHSDANLVIYAAPNQKVLWSTGTAVDSGCAAGSYTLSMQTDGNLVVYDDAHAGRVMWATDSHP